MSGGGKSSTSTSSVSIPPEVLARYNAVNARAEQVSQQPFTPYGGQFVAPLTQTQQAGVANINQAAGQAQPYYGAATQSLLGGASQAQPFYYGAAQNVYGAQAVAQPYQSAATGYTVGAGAAAQPLQQQSLASLAAGQAQANPLLYGSIGTMQQGAAASSPYIQRAGEAGLSGVSSAMGTQQQALAGLGAAAQAASPYYQATQQSMTGATLANQPFANLAAAGYAGAQGAASPYQNAAAANLFGAQAGAQPLQGQAAQDVTNALSGSQPYQQTATQLGLAGARQISPEELATEKYMSPYMKNVVESTMQNLRQQQQQEQSQILGSQIASGAFGGDRGRIAQANLARQQGMATGQTVSGLLNQGYSQALAAAQQQQGVALGAEQANRAAQAQASQQMAALGQQGFGQNLAASQQRAALGQQGFGQALATAQQQAALGQQLYGQQMGVAQAQQGLGAQGFAQNMAQAQMNQSLAQQMYNQGANSAQIQAAIAQQQANQGMQLGQLQAGLGSQVFGQNAQIGQQQANVGQALFGQGATAAQQQAALAQQAYAQQMGQGQQLAAIGQQGFGQGLASAQALQGIGQGLYGMGAGVSQGLAGLGTGAQQAALQGGQAQLAAGTVEQQTQQAQNQALYNQFLQQQGYPFQVAQFLANIAMGTGALSGSTTTTTQPSSFFSDKRLKDDIEPIGKTYDGQEIVRYRYKGEPATRIGLVAQDVEKKHPEAVGLAGGFKTVDYDKATDDAAARAPKAYGGGLNPWTDASMGGGVFREDAGAGFAAGGSPGDDVLAQINALVNSHQGMFPYGKAGMYGSGLGKAGPYGSTLMSAPNRGLMRAENVGTRPVSAMEGIESTMQRAENIQKMYRGAKGAGETIKEQTQISPEYAASTYGPQRPGSTPNPQTVRDYIEMWSGNTGVPESPSMYRGGLVRGNYAAGGLPYSNAEDEYVPEDISAPIKPAGLQPAKPPSQGRTTGDDLMTMAKLAAMGAAMFSSGGLVPRQGYERGGEPEDDTIAGYRRSAIEDMFNRGIIPNESGGRQFNERGEPLRSSAGAVGIGQIMPSTGPDAARLAGVSWDPERLERDPDYNRQLGLAYFTQQLRQHGDPLRAAAAYNAGPRGLERALADGEDYFSRLPSETQDYLRRFHGRLEPSGLIPPALASSVFNTQTAAPAEPTGVAPPATQRETQRAENPDWFRERLDKNEYWLVPLLTGLGTMASSPSRYLGSAILQGAMGAGQSYQSLKTTEGQRALAAQQLQTQAAQEARQRMETSQIEAGIVSSAEDVRSNSIRVYGPDGVPTLVPRSEYYRNRSRYRLAPYSPGERQQLGIPEPGRTAAAPAGQPAIPPRGSVGQESLAAPEGAPSAGQPTAQPSPQPEARPSPVYEVLPRDVVENANRVATEIQNTPPAVLNPATARNIWPDISRSAAAQSNTTNERNAFAAALANIPETGPLASGPFGQMIGTPAVSWANSLLRTLGSNYQINPAELATVEEARKMIMRSGIQQQAESGSRAFQELRAVLEAVPNAAMSRQAQADLIADSYISSQRQIDLNNFANLYRAQLRQSGLTENQLPFAGEQAENDFARRQNPAYAEEKRILSDMFMARTGSGAPLIKEIIQRGGVISPEMITAIEQRYGPRGLEVLRYFRGA